MIDLSESLRYETTVAGRTRAATFARSRVDRLLRSINGRRVAVFGDVMLDQFIWGDATRISPEAPVPVILLEKETWSAGGAANVATNIKSLGGEPMLFSVAGKDHGGSRLRSLLAHSGISTEAWIQLPNYETTVKQRILAQNKHVLRVDREHSERIGSAVANRLLDAFSSAASSCDAVVVSDYAKGSVTPTLLAGIAAIAERRGIAVCIDPKARDLRYRGTVMKPNLKELEILSGLPTRSMDEIEGAAARLLKQNRTEHLLVTRGREGMLLFSRSGERTRLYTGAQQVADVTGAGDTVLAALGLGIAAGALVREAAILANLAAGVVVTKAGTAIAHTEEILQALR